jgi:hypothetical protein
MVVESSLLDADRAAMTVFIRQGTCSTPGTPHAAGVLSAATLPAVIEQRGRDERAAHLLGRSTWARAWKQPDAS